MTTVIEPLILDFLEWLATAPRSYVDVMDAWRTSCPRLTIWEDAIEAGYVARVEGSGQEQLISLTPLGAHFLETGRQKRMSSTLFNRAPHGA